MWRVHQMPHTCKQCHAVVRFVAARHPSYIEHGGRPSPRTSSLKLTTPTVASDSGMDTETLSNRSTTTANRRCKSPRTRTGRGATTSGRKISQENQTPSDGRFQRWNGQMGSGTHSPCAPYRTSLNSPCDPPSCGNIALIRHMYLV